VSRHLPLRFPSALLSSLLLPSLPPSPSPRLLFVLLLLASSCLSCLLVVPLAPSSLICLSYPPRGLVWLPRKLTLGTWACGIWARSAVAPVLALRGQALEVVEGCVGSSLAFLGLVIRRAGLRRALGWTHEALSVDALHLAWDVPPTRGPQLSCTGPSPPLLFLPPRVRPLPLPPSPLCSGVVVFVVFVAAPVRFLSVFVCLSCAVAVLASVAGASLPPVVSRSRRRGLRLARARSWPCSWGRPPSPLPFPCCPLSLPPSPSPLSSPPLSLLLF